MRHGLAATGRATARSPPFPSDTRRKSGVSPRCGVRRLSDRHCTSPTANFPNPSRQLFRVTRSSGASKVWVQTSRAFASGSLGIPGSGTPVASAGTAEAQKTYVMRLVSQATNRRRLCSRHARKLCRCFRGTTCCVPVWSATAPCGWRMMLGIRHLWFRCRRSIVAQVAHFQGRRIQEPRLRSQRS